MSDKLKQELKEQSLQTAPVRSVDFQVDTLSNTASTSTAAYFSSWVNTITKNYTEGQDNSYNQSKATLAHEQKHRDNYKAIDSDTVPMSLEQCYKIRCYDEISANTCQLLQLRQEYLAAKTPAAKQKIIDDNDKFSYYFSAVKSGKINPESKSPAEFEKEMRFIAVETQKMWMDTFAKSYDKTTHTNMTKFFFNHENYSALTRNDANYNKVRKTYMTCGGIDFSKYIPDIPCINENVKEADKLIAAKAPRKQIEAKITPQTFTRKTLPMSLEEYAKLQSHQTSALQIKDFLDGRKKYLAAKTNAERQNIVEQYELYAYDQQIKNKKIKTGTLSKPSAEELKWITSYYNVSLHDTNDEQLEEIKKFYSTHKGKLQSNPKNYQSELKKLYTIDGIDFTPYVKDVIICNPNITNASKKAAAQQSVNPAEIKQHTFRDITVPVNLRTKGLSPQQQFELARKQMLIENLSAFDPMFQLPDFKNRKNIDTEIDHNIKAYIKQLQEDPKTRANWQKAERQLAERIIKQNRSTVILDKASDADFKKAMDNLTILPNGVDLQKYTNINIDATLKKQPVPTDIQKLENSTWNSRLGNKIDDAKNTASNYASSAWDKTKNYASSAWEKTKDYASSAKSWLLNEPQPKQAPKPDDSKAPARYVPYRGAPKYKEWSKESRVSPVQHEQIYDFSSDFLLKQQQLLAQNTPENTKKAMQTSRKAADELYAKRAPKTTRKPTRIPEPPKPKIIAPADNTNINRPQIITNIPRTGR